MPSGTIINSVALVYSPKTGITFIENAWTGSERHRVGRDLTVEDVEWIMREGSVVCIVRDPVERYISAYTHQVIRNLKRYGYADRVFHTAEDQLWWSRWHKIAARQTHVREPWRLAISHLYRVVAGYRLTGVDIHYADQLSHIRNHPVFECLLEHPQQIIIPTAHSTWEFERLFPQVNWRKRSHNRGTWPYACTRKEMYTRLRPHVMRVYSRDVHMWNSYVPLINSRLPEELKVNTV